MRGDFTIEHYNSMPITKMGGKKLGVERARERERDFQDLSWTSPISPFQTIKYGLQEGYV